MHLKGKKVDWPATITQDTWYQFHKLWKKEQSFMAGDYYKCKHLLSHMGQDEKIMFQHEEDPAKIMAGPLQIFRTDSDQVPRKIEELKNLKKPKPEDHPSSRRTC